MSEKENNGWWRGGVIYQIYPRSFQDSNNDGIGDIAGITQRLGYIASLGVDAIWISPFFPSPMKDFGYDISDYCDVDPIFGTLEDFKILVVESRKLGIKILIDLVMSHTSDQHLWFQESKSSRDNPKADWYVWSDPKADGAPPNNWLSIFGGSAWQWDSKRQQYYLHNFLDSQPDLNFHNDEVQDALLSMAKFWLDLGVDGFRLDTINFYFHDDQLRDNPPLPEHLRNSSIAPAVNPYNYQNHLYDKNRPENIAFLKRLRSLIQRYDAVAVGEVGDAQRGLEILGEYTAGDDLMHMCYAFEFLTNDRPEAADIVSVMGKVDEVATDGWVCWAFSNHDVIRQASRWNLSDEGLKLMTTLMMSLRGSACIYQGEELGLREADVSFDDLQDPYGIKFWPEFKGRDGCRTPMVWNHHNKHAGFSTSKPWLPIDPVHYKHSSEISEKNSASLLHHYRRAIAFRNAQPVLRVGASSKVCAEGEVVYFTRSYQDSMLFCAFNLSDERASLHLPDESMSLLTTELNTSSQIDNNTVVLEPWQAAFAKNK